MAKRQNGAKQSSSPQTRVARGGKNRKEATGRPRLKVKVVLYPDGQGGYTVVVPALPGCITEGDTRDEALANLREAVAGYLLCTPGAFEMEEGGIEEEIEL